MNQLEIIKLLNIKFCMPTLGLPSLSISFVLRSTILWMKTILIIERMHYFCGKVGKVKWWPELDAEI